MGSWAAGAHISQKLGLQGDPTLERIPSDQRATHTCSHSDRDSLGRPAPLLCTALGCGGKPAFPQKTHTEMGRTCKIHTGSGASQELIFFLLSVYHHISDEDTSNKCMGDTFLVLSRGAAHYNTSVLCGFKRFLCQKRETGSQPLFELYIWSPVLHIASLWIFPSFLPQSLCRSLPVLRVPSSRFVRDVGILAKGSFFSALNSTCEGVSLRTQDEQKLGRNLAAYLFTIVLYEKQPSNVGDGFCDFTLAILLKEKERILA